MDSIDTSILVAGIVCLVAAIVGGGVKILGAEMPVLNSILRQVLLGTVGVGLIIGALQPNFLRKGGSTNDAVGSAKSDSTRTQLDSRPATGGDKQKGLAPPSSAKNYSDLASGTASFDYSNNDGHFAIGSGISKFNTTWSSRSENSVYAYADPPSNFTVAIATGAGEIDQIHNPTAYDYSSRVRSANVGELLIWRNGNGVYAATKIIDVQYKDRNGDQDKLVFDYRILPKGLADFGGH